MRQPNFTDAMRALAAVGVLLGHGNYIASHAHEYGQMHQVFGLYPLAFFYIVSAKYALKSSLNECSFKKTIKRITSLLSLIVIYGIINEIPRFILFIAGKLPEYTPFGMTNLSSIITFITTGNNSLAFFLFQVIEITIMANLIARIAKIRYAKYFVVAILLVCCALQAVGNQQLSSVAELLFGKRSFAFGLILASFVYELIQPNVKKITSINGIVSVLIMIIPQIVGKIAGLIPFQITILVFGDILSQTNNKLMKKLSYAGEHYSLGIFLWHLPIFMVLDHFIPPPFQLLGFGNQPWIIIAALDITCLALSYMVTKILLNSKLKFLVSTN